MTTVQFILKENIKFMRNHFFDTNNYHNSSAIISYWGWIKSSNSYNFYKKYVKSKISIGKAKRIVSKYARQTNNLC
jgi:hypothetical protein